MAYVQPQENLTATWRRDGGAEFVLSYQGREWHRTANPDELVTVIEAAALLGVSRTAPYQWISERKLTAKEVRMTPGRKVKVIALPELRAFAETNGFPHP